MLITRSHFLSVAKCRNQQVNCMKNIQKLCSQTSLVQRFMSAQKLSNTNEENKIKIYYGSLTPKMKAVKIFSLTTSVSGLAAQPILMEQGSKIGGTGMAVFLCGFVGFFTFVTPLLLHFITKKYVTEIYYDSKNDEYTASTISLFLRKIETKFKPKDVKVPDVPGMFTSFIVGNKSLFLEPSQFTDPEHYVKIMGYDKPIDFKLELTENQNSENITDVKKKIKQ